MQMYNVGVQQGGRAADGSAEDAALPCAQCTSSRTGTPLLLTAEVCIMPEVAQHTLHCSTCPVVFLRKRMTDSTIEIMFC